jgi:hypothetical protein
MEEAEMSSPSGLRISLGKGWRNMSGFRGIWGMRRNGRKLSSRGSE